MSNLPAVRSAVAEKAKPLSTLLQELREASNDPKLEGEILTHLDFFILNVRAGWQGRLGITDVVTQNDTMYFGNGKQYIPPPKRDLDIAMDSGYSEQLALDIRGFFEGALRAMDQWPFRGWWPNTINFNHHSLDGYGCETTWTFPLLECSPAFDRQMALLSLMINVSQDMKDRVDAFLERTKGLELTPVGAKLRDVCAHLSEFYWHVLTNPFSPWRNDPFAQPYRSSTQQENGLPLHPRELGYEG